MTLKLALFGARAVAETFGDSLQSELAPVLLRSCGTVVSLGCVGEMQ